MKKSFSKAFLTKTSGLVFSYNEDINACFLKIGAKQSGKWEWKRCKMNIMELGEISLVLDGKLKGAKFYHDFNDVKTNIWLSRMEDKNVVFKIDKFKRALNLGEQVVMSTLIKFVIPFVALKDEEKND